jgi:hypothetical protein
MLGIRCHKARTSRTLGIRCHKARTTHLSLDGIPINHNGTKTVAGDLNHKYYHDFSTVINSINLMNLIMFLFS